MDARRGKDPRLRLSQSHRGFRGAHIHSRDNDALNPSVPCTTQYLLTVRVKLFHVDVGVRIGQHMCMILESSRDRKREGCRWDSEFAVQAENVRPDRGEVSDQLDVVIIQKVVHVE